jgi:hypothetical protein
METPTPPNNIENIFNKVKEYLPFASLIILIGGLLRLIIYYHAFKINITQFIDLSEIVILFLYIFIQYVIAVILLFPTFWMYYLLTTQPNRAPRIVQFVLAALLIMFYSMVNYVFNSFFSIEIQISANLVGLVMLVLFTYKFLAKKKINFGKAIVTAVVVPYILLCIVAPFVVASNFKKDKFLHNSSVVLEDRKIKPRENIYLVGFTRNYLFFYNDSSQMPEITPISKLKTISVNNLPYSSMDEYKPFFLKMDTIMAIQNKEVKSVSMKAVFHRNDSSSYDTLSPEKKKMLEQIYDSIYKRK